MTPMMGVSATAPSGTWYYNLASDKRGDTLSTNSTTYGLGGAVTIGTATDITKIAFFVKDNLTATDAKVQLLDAWTSEQSHAALANGTCTPADGAWCIVSVTYTASASTAYRVIFSTDATIESYGDSDGGIGIYTAESNYGGNFPAAGIINVVTGYATSFAVAICVGTCSTGP